MRIDRNRGQALDGRNVHKWLRKLGSSIERSSWNEQHRGITWE
jgi:hypothetical protein